MQKKSTVRSRHPAQDFLLTFGQQIEFRLNFCIKQSFYVLHDISSLLCHKLRHSFFGCSDFFIILSLILSSFLFMLSQNNAHPSSSKSMMPYDDDTLLANAHYIMKFPASQDETPKRLRLHSVIFLHLPYKPVLYDPVFPLWMPHRLPQRGHRLHWLLYESGQ